MFFVAESMTDVREEFTEAVDRFLRALRPGAPFAAAFVENSEGYRVGDRPFPAVLIGVDEVRAALAHRTERVTIERAGWSGPKWREGYTGMVLATGRIRAADVDTGESGR
jgi:hypothetical protein